MDWICPYCNLCQVVTGPKRSSVDVALQVHGAREGPIGMRTETIGCSNPECNGVEIKNHLISSKFSNHRHEFIIFAPEVLAIKQFAPKGVVKPQPEFIPTGLRVDYAEACLIRDLSPKASATLARRACKE
jgi:hypothetical protein